MRFGSSEISRTVLEYSCFGDSKSLPESVGFAVVLEVYSHTPISPYHVSVRSTDTSTAGHRTNNDGVPLHRPTTLNHESEGESPNSLHGRDFKLPELF